MKKLIQFVLHRVPRKYIQRIVHIATPVMGLAYAGRGVECPVCGARYRKFLPYGYVSPRENALCPRCLALERHRLMWLYLQNETTFFTFPQDGKDTSGKTKKVERHTARILHIAPEFCFIKRFEALYGENYVTADLESPLAKVKMDVQNIPFEDESFDIIFCNHILEHVENDRLAMREMYRVMRREGWGIMLSPVNMDRENTYENASVTDPVGREQHFGQKDHVRDYGRDYGQRLAEEGFAVEEIDYMKYLNPDAVKLYALRPEIIYLVRKL